MDDKTVKKIINIENIDKNSKWVSIEAKVIRLWVNNHETIHQTGLLGDDTGIIKFVNWANAEKLDLEVGRSYIIKNAIVSEYNGRYQINFNKKTEIEEI